MEWACLGIVVLFVVVRAARDERPGAFLVRLSLIVAAGWVAENTVIHAYGFYGYDADRWTLFIDQVPLMIILIWPVVIHSAWDLARYVLGREHPRVALLTAVFVWFDAWLIEPIATNAGLWQWFEPGLFDVPPIGVFGWAVFAYFAVRMLGYEDWRRLTTVVVAPAVTHAVLLGVWWGLLRWVNGSVASWTGVAIAVASSVFMLALAIRSRARRRIPRVEMLLRVPAASFFFVLLALTGASDPMLWPFAAAFVPPYLALVDFGWWTSVRTNG